MSRTETGSKINRMIKIPISNSSKNTYRVSRTWWLSMISKWVRGCCLSMKESRGCAVWKTLTWIIRRKGSTYFWIKKAGNRKRSLSIKNIWERSKKKKIRKGLKRRRPLRNNNLTSGTWVLIQMLLSLMVLILSLKRIHFPNHLSRWVHFTTQSWRMLRNRRRWIHPTTIRSKRLNPNLLKIVRRCPRISTATFKSSSLLLRRYHHGPRKTISCHSVTPKCLPRDLKQGPKGHKTTTSETARFTNMKHNSDPQASRWLIGRLRIRLLHSPHQSS